MRRTFALAAAAYLAAAAVACGRIAGWVREHTYPPSFEYIPDEKVESTMWELARRVNEIDKYMRGHAGLTPEQRQRVTTLLLEMRKLAEDLKKEERSNHPLLDANLPKLRSDIDRAIEGLTWDPPSYFFVGAVSGACVYCHSPPL
jgi:hypothetical protein